jgi:hypothetical protein
MPIHLPSPMWVGPRWLSVVAARTRAAEGGPSLIERRFARLRATTFFLATNEWSFVWLYLPLSIAPLFLIDLAISLPLHNDAEATQFIAVMWQVQAAALALSAAVVILALQVFAGVPNLRAIVRRSALLPVAYLGLSALVADGIVVVQHSQAGWPGLWVSILFVASIVGLWLLFVRVSRILDHTARLQADAQQLHGAVYREVDAEQLEDTAIHELDQRCKALGLEFDVMIGARVGRGWSYVRADQEAIVTDVDLWALGDLAWRAFRDFGPPATNSDRPKLCVSIGMRVGPQSYLVGLPPGTSEEAVSLAQRCVRYR